MAQLATRGVQGFKFSHRQFVKIFIYFDCIGNEGKRSSSTYTSASPWSAENEKKCLVWKISSLLVKTETDKREREKERRKERKSHREGERERKKERDREGGRQRKKEGDTERAIGRERKRETEGSRERKRERER